MEATHLAHIGRSRPITNCFDLRIINFNSLRRNQKTKKNQLISCKSAFGKICEKFLLAEDGQHLFDMMGMVLNGLDINKYVIKVDNNDRRKGEISEGLDGDSHTPHHLNLTASDLTSPAIPSNF